MKKTRKKKRKKTIEHGGDEGDQEITERSRMTDRESRGKRPREYLFRPGPSTWKMQLLMNVLSACADPDTDAWTKWLEQALWLNSDLDLLSDSGGDRFATIDIKMAMSMQNMLKQAPDEAKDVYLDATRHSELRHQQGVIVKGRELALVLQSFRTSDRILSTTSSIYSTLTFLATRTWSCSGTNGMICC